MAPKIPSRRPPTALGEFLKWWRNKHDMSQTELANEMGLEKKQYISKLETGAIQYPRVKGFFEKLENVTRESREKLMDLAREPGASYRAVTKGAVGQKVSVVGGHCVWGAPVVLAALSESSNIALSTVLTKKDGDYDTLEARDFMLALRDASPSEMQAFQPLSGATALDMLDNEDDFDMALVADELLARHPNSSSFLSVLSIARQASCVLVCTAEISRIFEPDVYRGEPVYLKQIAEAWKQRDFPSLAVEADTAAGALVERVWEICAASSEKPASEWSINNTYDTTELAAKRSDFTFEGLAKSILHKERPPLEGIVTWEPWATWLRLEDQTLRSFPIRPDSGVNGRQEPITFDLVTTTSRAYSRRGSKIMRAIDTLVPELVEQAARLNEVDSENIPPRARRSLLKLGEYFQMYDAASGQTEFKRIEHVLRAVGGTYFRVDIDPDFWKFMGSTYVR